MATFNTELSRKGPGLLLRDILRGKDPQIDAVIAAIVASDADVIALQGFDYDLELTALAAFKDALADAGNPYAYHFAAPPNAGRMTPFDLDGDGKTGGPADAQGYGRFFGQGSMAVLSRHPIQTAKIRNFSNLLWHKLPGAIMPAIDGSPFPSDAAQKAQRLFSHGAWVVPIDHPTLGTFHLMTFHAGPPVFDGPEDRNGRRNHDEIAFWSLYLDGAFGPAPQQRFVIAADANLDPAGGDGRSEAMRALLARSDIQDPLADQPTVEWAQTGKLRVDYVLPSSDWQITDAGLGPDDPAASRHRLVWVDLRR